MATPAALAYRKAYQLHRAGLPTGATGERPEEVEEGKGNDGVANNIERLLDDSPQNDNSYHGGVYGAHEMNKNETGYSTLLQWRLSYQLHRSGAAAGAKGEVGAGLSVADVRQLPVALLAAHFHALKLKAAKAMSPQKALSADAGHARPVHVHVGAGRLGLGLVVPALARASRENGGLLVLLQRPSDAWAALAHGSAATLSVRKEGVCRLRVVRSGVKAALEEVKAERAAAKATASGRAALADLGAQRVDAAVEAASGDESLLGLLVLTESESELDALAWQVTSLSCSLGPALESGMAPLLAALTRASEGGAADYYGRSFLL